MSEEWGAPVRVPAAGRRRRPRSSMVATTVVWVVLLGGGAVWAARNGGPTAREQTTVAQAQPTVDRAAGQLAAAASADGRSVVAISGFERVGDCRVTILRRGARYQRVVTAFVPTGQERATLDRVRERLPGGYRATVRRGSVPKLSADAGLFVGLTGVVSGPGQVRFVVDTGNCRPEGAVVASNEPGADRAAVATVLATLGISPAHWYAYSVPCPSGTALRTIEAVSLPGPRLGALDVALKDLGGNTAAVATPDLVAYRSASVGVAVHVLDGRVHVSATTMCR